MRHAPHSRLNNLRWFHAWRLGQSLLDLVGLTQTVLSRRLCFGPVYVAGIRHLHTWSGQQRILRFQRTHPCNSTLQEHGGEESFDGDGGEAENNTPKRHHIKTCKIIEQLLQDMSQFPVMSGFEKCLTESMNALRTDPSDDLMKAHPR